MALLLGVDTGGTYTDAVIYAEDAGEVIASAKAPTTPDALAAGIEAAITSVLDAAGVVAASIQMVSLSTTLATNALVEGKGQQAGLVLIGFDEKTAAGPALDQALDGGPVIRIRGGHDPHGMEREPLDTSELAGWVRAHTGQAAAFAVTGEFGVRNTAHELVVRDHLLAMTDRPVTCGYQLSDALDGPRRAVTAILNARLIGLTASLVESVAETMIAVGIQAPLMVVRGDGSLVAADYARERPVETLLSGPAASIVGAGHLTGRSTALVADIGGTTTDIGILVDGEVALTPSGATVGGHRTMVEAVDMVTCGLGGDSEVRMVPAGMGLQLTLGPRRVIPLCLLGAQYPEATMAALDRDLQCATARSLDGLILVPRSAPWPTAETESLGRHERDVMSRVSGPTSATDAGAANRDVLEGLVNRGLIQLAGFTPTDAAHALGRQTTNPAGPALAGAMLAARQRDRRGEPCRARATEMATAVLDLLVRRSAEAVLGAALTHDGLPAGEVSTRVVQASLDRHAGVTQHTTRLTIELIGLGTPASLYYPSVAAMIGADVIVPEHAEVANAVGAVVGRVRIADSVMITSPECGEFLIHLHDRVSRTTDLDEAVAAAEVFLRGQLSTEMRAAGAGNYDVQRDWCPTVAMIEDDEVFIDGRLTLVATGRPQLAGSATSGSSEL